MSDNFAKAYCRSLEAKIVNDILARTGYAFESFNRIDVKDPTVARQVLPVLNNWVEMLDAPNLRAGIYSLFGRTSITYEWFDALMGWWIWEPDAVAKSGLTTLIARTLLDKDGPAVWRMCKDVSFPFDSMILARLMRIKDLRHEVVVRILFDLNTGSLQLGDLEIYSRVPDGRIQKWFVHAATSSADAKIRRIAERLQAQASVRPEWINTVKGVPDRQDCMYSTETDLPQLDRELSRITKTFSLPPRRLGSSKSFLAFASPDQWFQGELSASVELWLRAEDQDVVELVVTRRSSEKPCHSTPSQ